MNMVNIIKHKFILMVCIFCILPVCCCYSAEYPRITNQSFFTDGKPNGDFWKILDETEKVNFINGILQGIILCAELESELANSGQTTKDRVDALELLAQRVSSEKNIDIIIKQIDIFYESGRNLNIPISRAYLSVIKKNADSAN